jgi:GNAT superfamily N-acetyltransferase
VKIVTRDLKPSLWPAMEELFAPNGACAGCWCMWWRLGPGEPVRLADGPKMKRRQRALVAAGRSQGVLAFADGEPVGWCAWARRTELPRLQRSPTLACDDADRVFSLPCFFVKAGFRRKGVARVLLRHALKSIRAGSGRIAEAYPVRCPPSANGRAFTGTVAFLESEGFTTLTSRPRGRQRARRTL